MFLLSSTTRMVYLALHIISVLHTVSSRTEIFPKVKRIRLDEKFIRTARLDFQGLYVPATPTTPPIFTHISSFILDYIITLVSKRGVLKME